MVNVLQYLVINNKKTVRFADYTTCIQLYVVLVTMVMHIKSL